MDAFKRRKWKFAPRSSTVSRLLNNSALELEEQLSTPEEFTFNSHATSELLRLPEEVK